MADSMTSPETAEAKGGEPEGAVLQSGDVKYKGREHKFCLTDNGLALEPVNKEEKIALTLDVSWLDVVCACEALSVKKSKSSDKQISSDCAAEQQEQAHNDAFVLHYIERNENTHKLQCKDVTLETTAGTSDGWIAQIEEKRRAGKPWKLLIVVSSYSGSRAARQTFDKQVHPIFALAGVEVIVKVTEREKHAIEIAKTFDISSVDGVIAMGGDGTFMEILHGLMLRKQEEEEVNFNDPESKLVPPTVRVGMIPAGTGNKKAQDLYGIIDVESAALNIVRGEIGRSNIFSVHESERLVSYGGLMMANGYFSDLLKKTDDLRWMKTFRYPYAMMTSTFGKKKILEFNIEVLRKPQDTSTTEETKAGEASAGESGQCQWTKLGARQIFALCMFPACLKEEGEVFFPDFSKPGCGFLIISETSGLEVLKWLFGVAASKRSVMDKEYIEHVTHVQGLRLEYIPQHGEAEPSKQQKQLDELAKVLNIDGELFVCSNPKFEIRLHEAMLQVFCAPTAFSPDGTS